MEAGTHPGCVCVFDREHCIYLVVDHYRRAKTGDNRRRVFDLSAIKAATYPRAELSRGSCNVNRVPAIVVANNKIVSHPDRGIGKAIRNALSRLYVVCR